MKIYHERGMIYFHFENETALGFTEFEEELWKKISSTKWHIKRSKKNGRGYINSSKLGTLHQLVMAHWYGEEAFLAAKEKNFVIDHMNNKEFDCRVSNLCFIPKGKNTAKGQTFDKDRLEYRNILVINIFKDFKTQLFQITIGFNSPAFFKTNEKSLDITSMRLTYENDFYRVFSDAEKILYEFIHFRKFDIHKLNHIRIDYTEAVQLPINDNTNGDTVFFEVDGKLYLNLNSKHARLEEVVPDFDGEKE